MIPEVSTKADLEAAGMKVWVYVPLERTIHSTVYYHLWHIAQKGWEIPPLIYGRTDLNRNLAARETLKGDWTHIVMLDGDHLHPPDVVERLARWPLADPGRLVVGGLNFRRTAPYDPCMFHANEEGRLVPPIKWDAGLVEVDAIGHGCIIISREVFETFGPPWWAYPYNHAERDIYPSEDMVFCQQAKKHGISLYCDTTTTSPHQTEQWVTAEAFYRFIEANRDAVETLGQDQRAAANGQMGTSEGKRRRPRKPKPVRETA